MQPKSKQLKIILSNFRVFVPGLLITLIFTGFSYIGVFIEEDFLLMLQGGFNNIYVVAIFYLLSHITGWVLSFLIFRYQSLFQKSWHSILVPIVSTLFILFSQLLYYVIIFYLSTGLLVWEVSFLLSQESQKLLATLIFMILNGSVVLSIISNLIGIHLQRKKPQTSVTTESVSTSGSQSEEETTSSFEDSISI